MKTEIDALRRVLQTGGNAPGPFGGCLYAGERVRRSGEGVNGVVMGIAEGLGTAQNSRETRLIEKG